MLSTISDKGQLTVPKKLRDAMGITPGARLDLQLLGDGTLRIRVMARGADKLFGLLAKPGESARTLEDMDGAVNQAVRARSKRSVL